MHDIMLDLETMGSDPNAALCAIGAVSFDIASRQIINHFYMPILLEDSVRCGGVIDPETVIWWLKQSDAARAEISDDGYIEPLALGEFTDFIASVGQRNQVRIWGNGSDFDNVILASAYRRNGLSLPWDFRNNRCYRTVKNLHPAVALKFVGDRHNALHDAENQARHLIAMLNPEADRVAQ